MLCVETTTSESIWRIEREGKTVCYESYFLTVVPWVPLTPFVWFLFLPRLSLQLQNIILVKLKVNLKAARSPFIITIIPTVMTIFCVNVSGPLSSKIENVLWLDGRVVRWLFLTKIRTKSKVIIHDYHRDLTFQSSSWRLSTVLQVGAL